MRGKNIAALLVVVAVIVVVAVVLVRVSLRPAMRAEVMAADDREFFPVIHEMLQGAAKSVDVVLYQTRFYFHYPLSASNILIADLADAGQRGVRVRVVVELADWNLENSEENRDVWTILRENGAEVYFDPWDKTSHSKLVIVDGEYTVVGSSNWSYYSLDMNNEANVVIKSAGVAGEFEKFFEGVIEESGRSYEPPLPFLTASEAMNTEGRYALIRDLPVSIAYDDDMMAGFIEFKGATVTVSEGDLESLKAVYPDFFEPAPLETLRILARVRRDGGVSLEAIDVEKAGAAAAMKAMVDSERVEIKALSIEKPVMQWTEAGRVEPVPTDERNERKYVDEVNSLIDGATERIWIAMLNAIYYESTPSTAREGRQESVPSYTNLMVERLEAAAKRGVDVRAIVDVDRRGTPSRGEDRFLERLRDAGASVYTDSPEITTHAKLLIVDSDYTVLGSTNWTYHAVEENNETSVIIDSPDLNRHYAGYIENLIVEGTPYTR
jgi:phosphatidylserine/phosphatidylglycerophosphate/cardiolipin synthase-like enzyme